MSQRRAEHKPHNPNARCARCFALNNCDRHSIDLNLTHPTANAFCPTLRSSSQSSSTTSPSSRACRRRSPRRPVAASTRQDRIGECSWMWSTTQCTLRYCRHREANTPFQIGCPRPGLGYRYHLRVSPPCLQGQLLRRVPADAPRVACRDGDLGTW